MRSFRQLYAASYVENLKASFPLGLNSVLESVPENFTGS